MRKILIILLSSLFILAGCKKEELDDQTKNETVKSEIVEQVDSNETDQLTEKVEAKPDATPEPEANEEQNEAKPVSDNQEVEQGMNLLQYRPEVGSKKSFTENGELVFTEEIIAANDEYVQTLLQLGDNKTTQIYRWTKDEITLIYEDYNLENSNKDLLNTFVPIEQFETIMNNDSSKAKTWKLLSNEEEEAVPAGDYKNVLTVQKTTEEVVNEETTYTRYYAPGIGLIKEEYHVTGENGYSSISELETIE